MKTQKTINKEVIFNKVVNVNEDGEIIMLDRVFDHGKGFKGAVGTKFEPVSRDKYDEIMERDNVIDRIVEVGVPEQFARGGANVIVNEAMLNNNEIEDFMFDLSYREMWDDIREQVGLTAEQAVVFNCIGGGRCFDEKFKGNVNPELSKIIREYEA